ncbi:MAG: M15 family metallopeptidase [Lachnospiraceae bacterium]|nr:M15 family metallopeptidase [Lachnospiraceae bacterium]
MKIRKMKTGSESKAVPLFAALLGSLILLTSCALPLLPGNGTDSESGQAAAGESGNASASLSEAPLPEAGPPFEGQGTASEAEKAARLSFREADLHSGDLILVNSRYPYDFNANAETLDLSNILEKQSYRYQVEKEEYAVAGRILPHLDAMIETCDTAMKTQFTGITSAYRSYEYQEGVMKEITELYGEDYASRYVAAPGSSEHHTGLAVDVGIFYENGLQGTFSESENAVWMRENCWQYGFIRRYAEDKTEITGISNEAWHFRYVGLPHAFYMHENNLCLEEYLDLLRNETAEDEPLRISCEGREYRVFFTPEEEIDKPDTPYQVSGNNVDGFIVTIG